jgi:hypothetical protein
VGVEKFNAGTAVELDRLHGTWLLQYTTAPDVISLLQAAELPFLQVLVPSYIIIPFLGSRFCKDFLRDEDVFKDS